METGYKAPERRRFARAVFTKEEKIEASLSFSDNNKDQRNVQVMNMSKGGIGLTIKREDVEGIKIGACLKIDAIMLNESESVNFSGLEIEVAWVMDYTFLENVGFGVEFINPNEKDINVLLKAINTLFPGRIE
jgi:c-di-GMP-binding flagellar brake protein YcgR